MNEELKVIISAEISKLKKGIADAKEKVSSFKDEVKKASKNVDEKFSNMGASISSGLKAGAAAIVGVKTALVVLVASTEEYREAQAKLTTAFEAAGGSAVEAKETYNDLYRVLGDSGQATEAASHLAKLTTEEKALSEWTNICQGVYATFGESLPIEGLTEAANETAKVGTVTGGLADALNWAGISEDAFNEKLAACNTEAEREKLIRETLNGLYSDAAAMYEENNAQVLAQRDAQAQLQEQLALLSEAVAPIITAFTSLANDALAVVVPYIQQLAQDYAPQLQAVLEKTGAALETAFTWVSQHKEVLAVMAGIIGGITAAIGLYNAVAAIKAAMAAAEVTSVLGLVAAYTAQAAAMIVAIAPYVLIVAFIAAVIAIIVVCVKHWDEFKAKVAEAWGDIKAKTSEAVENVKQKFTEMKEKTAAKVEEMKAAAVNKFQEIKSGISDKLNAARDAVTNVFDNIKNGIKDKLSAARDTVKSIIDKIKSFFKFEWSLPKLKLPSIKITGKFSLNPPSTPKFSINWNALGGVFDKPAIFGYGGSLQGIGENGAEAVVPLEKNTQWLNRLADMLGARMGGGKPIILQVDGKTFAQISVDSINALTKQTGSMPLKLY